MLAAAFFEKGPLKKCVAKMLTDFDPSLPQWCVETPSVGGGVLTNWPTITTKKIGHRKYCGQLSCSMADFWPTFLRIWKYWGSSRPHSSHPHITALPQSHPVLQNNTSCPSPFRYVTLFWFEEYRVLVDMRTFLILFWEMSKKNIRMPFFEELAKWNVPAFWSVK